MCMMTAIQTLTLADRVRDLNADLWAPDAEMFVIPDVLLGEPPLLDAYEAPDGRGWVRVYIDGSALDERGHVSRRAPNAARERRIPQAA